MRIVSIDSSLASALALIELSDGVATTVRQQVGTDARHHAESLAPMLSQVLAGEAVDAIAVATGPAPFTGLRAGLVTARTFARVHNLPLWGVSSLDARARAAFDRLGQVGQGKCLLVANDARRKEVYAARYQVKGADDVERLGQLHVLSPELGEVDYVTGSGVALYPQQLTGTEVDSQDPILEQLARIAWYRHQQGIDQPTEPLYLRHADVQMPKAPKRVI